MHSFIKSELLLAQRMVETPIESEYCAWCWI